MAKKPKAALCRKAFGRRVDAPLAAGGLTCSKAMAVFLVVLVRDVQVSRRFVCLFLYFFHLVHDISIIR